MGKLVLTRRAGESVKLTEPNGNEWFVVVRSTGSFSSNRPAIIVLVSDGAMRQVDRHLRTNESIMFAGGNVELRPHKRPDQAILAFDFPRDVTIVRTEIA